jgi:hypothetical protein
VKAFSVVVLAMFLVCSFISIAIPLSVYLSYDDLPKSTVVESMCTCDCWDGLYKVSHFFLPPNFLSSSSNQLFSAIDDLAQGKYGRGRNEYRAVYWNMERGTYFLLLVSFRFVFISRFCLELFFLSFARPSGFTCA